MNPRGAALAAMTLVAGCQAYDRPEYALLADGVLAPHDATASDVPRDLAARDAADDVLAVDNVVVAIDARADDAADDVALDVPVDVPVDAPIDARPDVPVDVPGDVPIDTAPPDVILNGSFENTGSTWLQPWYFYVQSTAMGTVTQDNTTATAGTYSVRVDVPVAPALNWYVQLTYHTIHAVAARPETLTFSAKSSVPGVYEIALQQSSTPYATYAVFGFTTTTSWQRFTLHFMSSATDPTAQLVFDLAPRAASIWLDDIALSP